MDAYTYLDHAATTPTRPEVTEAVVECWTRDFGNPSSTHRAGRQARKRLEEARRRVAAALGTTQDSVLFVRGGTESDNLALLGWARHRRSAGTTPVVLTSAVEHPAVREAAGRVAGEGGVHRVVPVDPETGLDLDALVDALQEAALVSCMWVNNETGLVLPIDEVVTRAHGAGAVVHSDAVQAVGKVPVRLDETAVDLLTVTGHKIYGPRGTGVLVNHGGIPLAPLHVGGGQERGFRPGTEDVAGAVGFAVALELAVAEQGAESLRMATIRDSLAALIVKWDSRVRVNGGELSRAPHILSLGIPDVEADTLLAALDMAGFAASGGSACSSGSAAPASTVQALYGPSDPLTTLRLSFGKATREGDVERIARRVAEACDRVRQQAVA
ncbi:MAG: cysteine desulfurase [Gemmatimonadetes bacterium]|nr:cysteine desulfurase [Gemmatimonadota bacterium]